MKKISVLLFGLLTGLLAASPSFAQTAVCTAGVASPVVAAANMFIVRGFTARCSANVSGGYRENAVAFAIGTLSSKGKSYFQGNTGGGAISGTACGVTCTAGQEDTGLAAALAAAT